MKHHCHCGFKKRHQLAKGKKLGVLGAALMVLHLLYHVAECLILPAVFMAWSGRPVEASETEPTTKTAEIEENIAIAEHADPNAIEAPKLKTLFSQNLYTDFFETLH